MEVFGCGEFRFYRIVPDVAEDILEMFLIANQAIEIIFLPNTAGAAGSLLDLVGGKSFPAGDDFRQDTCGRYGKE